MIINKEAFTKEIFEPRFNRNYSKCAKVLGVTTPQLHRFLNTDSQAGAKLLGGLYAYCQDNDITFNDYILLENINCSL